METTEQTTAGKQRNVSWKRQKQVTSKEQGRIAYSRSTVWEQCAIEAVGYAKN